VVGNSAYPGKALENPKNDATEIHATFRRLGFDAELKLNATKAELDAAFRRFSRKADRADVAILFYAGHGMQVNGNNYLVPIDANPQSERDLKRDMVKLDDVIDDMGNAKVKMVFFDACRDNPLSRSFSRGGSRGLAAPVEATGTLISFATKHGTTADDGNGKHSPYTEALLAELSNPVGVEIESMLRRVQQTVRKSTRGQQEPWRYGSLDGEFYFAGATGTASRADAAPAQQQVLQRVDPAAIELSFWESMKDSRNPEELKAYLDRFPGGSFAALAQARLRNLANLSQGQVVAVAPGNSSAARPPAATVPEPGVLRWRLASSFPKSLDNIFGAAQVFAKVVSERTNGRFSISTFAAGEILPAFEVVDAVNRKTIELAHMFPNYFYGKDPAWILGASLPFAINGSPRDNWLQSADGRAEFGRFVDAYKLVSRPLGAMLGDLSVTISGGTRILSALDGWWCRREIRGVADLKGLKVRIGGIEAKLWQKIGVIPVAMPGAEVYTALERGVIDCAVWGTPYDDERIGFYKVAPYFHSFYGSDEVRSSRQSVLLINADAWRALPPEYRQAIEDASAEADRWMRSQYEAANSNALQRMLASGARLRPFTSDVVSALRAGALSEYEEESKRSPEFARLYQAWKQSSRR
jgi:TRAP-type mannitol/chloroaromatic compound transport system substrate-binding protein